MRIPNTRLAALLAAALLPMAAAGQPADADRPDVDTIVEKANLVAYYGGDDGRSEVRMVIYDEQGREQRRQFTILRRDIEDGGDQEFLVVFSRPSDVRGTTFLVKKHVGRDDDRWLYLPGLDLVKRISAGDKRTSFVGAHYFYEDVSGRSPEEDEHEFVEETDEYYVLRHIPKDPDVVEFAEYTTWIDKETWLPMRIEYTNPAGEMYRTIEAGAVETIEGIPTVTKSRVEDKSLGGYTLMQFRFIDYDIGLPADIFTERSLRRPPREWLERTEGGS
jgi:hypothetical protein